jgi:murein L,D-transpeptidase YcbB/YkuD
MRGLPFDRFLAGTALALVLTVTAPAWASNEAAIEAAIPVPEAANVPPPTAADVAAATPQIVPARPAEAPAPATTASIPPAATPAATSPAPVTTASTPPAAAPAPAATAPATPAPTAAEKPQEPPLPVETAKPSAPVTPDGVDVKTLAGKDLIKAPIAAGLAAEDVAVAEKLRDLLANRGDRYFSRKGERSAAEVFYRDRGFAPVWSSRGAPSARGTEAIAYLRGIEADGMNPADYPLPQIMPGSPDALAEAELKFTGEVLKFARHAMGGRVHYSRVSGDIGYELDTPDESDVLKRLAGRSTVAEILDSYQPQHPQYKMLKAKLAEARGKTDAPAPKRIESGPLLRPGSANAMQSDDRVPALRERLGVAAKAGDTGYDAELVEAVKKFQKQAGLNPDGVVGQGTVNAMNGGGRRERSADIIIANLERWRWAPHDLGKTYVMVNIPDFSLKIVRDGKPYWTTRIVTGKPSQPTPITTASMKFITVNPTWNVPPSIIANEYLPAVRQDPTVLERMGLRMEQNRDGTVRIYQPPGDRNALGRIRFNFPNKFLVYQHDTPDKHLFAHDKRAYSHGCMRVQDPLMYGEKLLSIVLPQEKYTAEKLRSMFGGSEININFPVNLPVHLTYQTAFVDDAGNLVIRDDIYGRDSRLVAILNGDERKVADIPVERSHTGSGVSRDALRFNAPGGDSMFSEWFAQRGYDRSTVQSGGPRGGPRGASQNPFAQLFGGFFR